jgi:hypothetical protein
LSKNLFLYNNLSDAFHFSTEFFQICELPFFGSPHASAGLKTVIFQGSEPINKLELENLFLIRVLYSVRAWIYSDGKLVNITSSGRVGRLVFPRPPFYRLYKILKVSGVLEEMLRKTDGLEEGMH